MYSIKSSFADCLSCQLLDAPSCILETNSPDNLEAVDVVFISENPGKNEIERDPPTPLVGKAGQTFRKYFDKYVKKNFKWLLTNTVLCATINEDGTTGNPDKETIERCKENCFAIIEACKPKLIVLMGTTPMSAFGIAESGITTMRGNVYKWRNYDVFIMLHPSFINRQRSYEERFMEDIKKIPELLGLDLKEVEKIDLKNAKTGIHYYKIPDKFYTSEYKLIDVQFLNMSNEVLYIFRDRDNKKIYHKENDDYYCYQLKDNTQIKKVLPYDNLIQVKVPYRQKMTLDSSKTYEGDLKITVKHAMDYYLQKTEEEPDLPANVMFIDIETYSESMAALSTAEEAENPIAMLTYMYGDSCVTYVVDPKFFVKTDTQKIDLKDGIIICKNEKELLTKFSTDLKKIDPDIITGWNSNYFDMPYILNRMKKVGMSQSSLSRFNQISIEMFHGYVDIAGMICLDMMDLYKSFVQNKKESYSLNAISMDELKRGKTESGSMFSNVYREDINRSIVYNINDVDLLKALNAKLRHIQLQDELKKICKASYRAAKNSMGQLDSLIVSFLKEKGLSSKNTEVQEKSEKFEGAYVKEPMTGLHNYICDFDFASLYPSIIMTLNIGVNTFCMKLKDYKMGYDFVYHRDKLPGEIDIIVDPINKNQEFKVKTEDLIKKVESENLTYSINGCFFKKSEQSFYSGVLSGLLSSRKVYKKKMFEAKEKGEDARKELYNIRQLVYKVLANALYGVLGNNAFRFFNIDCARSITLTGQEMIKTAILEANNYIESFKPSGKYVKPQELSSDEMYGEMDRPTPNVITGDTDSLFATFKHVIDKKKDLDINEVQGYCDKLQSFLNNQIISEIISKHNIDNEMNKLELKNELIIERGLFVSKKHYVVNVVSQEGVKTDEMVVMGLDTKRSDYPRYTKECLKELFDIILKTKNFSLSKINQYVKGKEKEFVEKISAGDKTIARPVSWGKKLKDYKSVPQGVKAMMNWNDLMYNIHNVGSKGYLFHVQGIDFDNAPKEVIENYNKNFLAKGKKLDVIAVPEDEDGLPKFLYPNVTEMVKFSWKDRYNILLEPMGGDIKNTILKF